MMKSLFDRYPLVVADPDRHEESEISYTILPAYDIGAFVYHRAGNGVLGIVTGYLIRTTGLIYQVTWGESRGESGHFGCELTTEKPF
jgi:hypothetical protein